MKKQRFFMLGIITVLVAVLSLTFVSSTFAKYTTNDSAEDTARVAKWGVSFAAVTKDNKEYGLTAVADLSQLDSQDTQISTVADAKLLAPGAKVNLAFFEISGKPEVAFNVTYEATLDLANWSIPEYYCPLVITVNDVKYYGLNYANVGEFVTAVEEAIENLSKDYAADDNLATAEAPKVTVEWAFESENGTKVNASDANDTKLGDNANATLSLTITATVTQID